MTTERFERVNFYDFHQVSGNDLYTDQQFAFLNSAADINTVAGSGVLLDFPQEKIIFDSDDQTDYQQGLVAIGAFDGQGILDTPYLVQDQTGGSQISVEVSGSRLHGFLKMSVYFLGKSFDDTLIYEVMELTNNTIDITKNHFKEITNILFQNFLGNDNTSIDGYGSFNVGGRVLITEASSMKLGRDAIVAEQIIEPNMAFRFFKTSSSGKSLSIALQEALGADNDLDDLDINTTAASQRIFEEGGASSVIYGQKFKMEGNNIQKISLLMYLESGNDFSGTLVVGIRKLQNSENATTEFLPDDDIAFDPDISSIEEISIDQDDLEDQGIVLTTDPQIVDFIFTGSNISNPSLSGLISGDYYVLTVRRTGSSTTGTIILDEARNSDEDLRLTVFSSGVWTDIEDSSLWFRIWNNSLRAASGIVYDNGIRLVNLKVEENDDGVLAQSFIEDINLVNTGEDAENYILVQSSISFIKPEPHPRTADLIASRKVDVPLISAIEQDDLETLLDTRNNIVILGRVRDRNAKSNPVITDTLDYPGLAIGDTITVINPGADLLTQNIVGSIITPNIAKPSIRYRVIRQTVSSDLYGDLDGDGFISVDDQARLTELDGWAVDLNGGTVSAATQLSGVLSGNTSVAELLRADVSGDGLITDAADGYYLDEFINNGTALPVGSGFTRLEIQVEPMIDPMLYLDEDAGSSLQIQNVDTDLKNNTSFSTITLKVEFLPTWEADNIEILDLRRYITTTFVDFTATDLTSSPESGGRNNLFVPGDLFLTGSVKELDGTAHALDYERNLIEIELPEGTTDGEINIFTNYVVDKMRYSDGTLVANTALNNNQVKFELSISSIAKDIGTGDFVGLGEDAYQLIGTYLDPDTGLLRIEAYNIVYNELFPQVRTRLQITVSLKKAGFNYSVVQVSLEELNRLLT